MTKTLLLPSKPPTLTPTIVKFWENYLLLRSYCNSLRRLPPLPSQNVSKLLQCFRLSHIPYIAYYFCCYNCENWIRIWTLRCAATLRTALLLPLAPSAVVYCCCCFSCSSLLFPSSIQLAKSNKAKVIKELFVQVPARVSFAGSARRIAFSWSRRCKSCGSAHTLARTLADSVRFA